VGLVSRDAAELIAAARALIAYSDGRDRETAARLAGISEGYGAGYAAGDRDGAEAVHEWYAEQDRDIAAALAGRPSPARTAAARARWHVCCRPCRLAGHRDGCAGCEDRARETFGAPHSGDYPGAVSKAAA
jgi:hypothetical protein